VPINTRYRGPEARELIVRTRARALLVEQGFLGYDHVGALLADGDDAGGELAGLGLVVVLSADGQGQVHQGPDAPGLLPKVLGWDEFLSAESEARHMVAVP
jgi:HIP---CoA ligase